MGHHEDVADTVRSARESVPMLWLRLRNRWEYGHVAGFVLQLAGFCALVQSVLIETPKFWQGEKSASKAPQRERIMATRAR